MKIAIPATAPDLGARVENRLGTAAYLLVIDIEDLSFEAVPGPSRSAGPGAGVEAISIVTRMGAKVILAGFVSPHIALPLEKVGIDVITPVSGSVMDAVVKYRQGAFSRVAGDSQQAEVQIASPAGPRLLQAFRRAARQFFNIIPVLLGVILLVGLFRGFVSRDLLLTIFSGNVLKDTLWGACIGSVFSGNPVNSYVVGETLLKMGGSLFGATALMLTWVNVGLLQLPAEISALGARFAITRTIAAFLMAIVVSIVTVILLGGHV
jgi:predicted Fe-Mo cluster-binding NifX family protein